MTFTFANSGFFESGALKLLLEGGPFMWPLLILLIMTIAVIIERYRSLKLLDTDSDALREEVVELLSNDKVEDSLQLCDNSRGPVPAILSNGLRKYLVLRRLKIGFHLDQCAGALIVTWVCSQGKG